MRIFLLIYLGAVNLLAVLAVVWDKRKARRGEWRIRESTLLALAAIGGSLGMYMAMLRIRHKTKHRKFMVGLPLIILFQLLVAGFAFIYIHGWLPN